MVFIKSHWDMLKVDVMATFEKLYASGKFDNRLNASFITLVPKISNPVNLNEYLPNSLVGCIYKIIARFWPSD